MDLDNKIATLGITYLAFLFSLCFHEYAHAWMSKLKGDRTAEMMGRLTLNPLAHADLFGTFIMPIMSLMMGGIFFGYAKPVIFDERNLKKPKTDTAWIAAAGPLANIVLAFIAILGYQLCLKYFEILGTFAEPVIALLYQGSWINLSLAFFNLIPLPPLDGSKVLQAFLSPSASYKLDSLAPYTFFIILGLIFSGAIAIVRVPMHLTYQLMTSIVGFIF